MQGDSVLVVMAVVLARTGPHNHQHRNTNHSILRLQCARWKGKGTSKGKGWGRERRASSTRSKHRTPFVVAGTLDLGAALTGRRRCSSLRPSNTPLIWLPVAEMSF